MSFPLLSVIVPVFNSEKYLEDCLLSIINQTYKNLEIIIVNDGSSDSSEDIIYNLSKTDYRIQYIYKTNEGVSAARNMGIINAKGDYITFVDSDDTLDKEMYQKMMETVLLHDADIVCCGYSKISLIGKKTEIAGTVTNVEMNGDKCIEHLLRGDLFTGSPCSKIYRKQLLRDIRFREDLKINEDVYFNYCAMKMARCFVYIQDPLYYYYEREGATTQITSRINKQKDAICVSECIYKDSINKSYENLARTKYIYGLMNYYRLLLNESSTNNIYEKRRISETIFALLKMPHQIQRKYVISFCGMKICPHLYIWLYKFYDRVRKPNWDIVVQKEKNKWSR